MNKENQQKEPMETASIQLLLGQILKEKRQDLKVEIADVSAYLKIKNRDIEAIENGEFDAVTKHLYATGLVRSYAKFLKIDPNLIEEKIKLLPIKSNVENKKHQLLNIGEDGNLSPSKDNFFNFLLISVLLFLVLLSLYNYSENKNGLITDQNLIQELEKINI